VPPFFPRIKRVADCKVITFNQSKVVKKVENRTDLTFFIKERVKKDKVVLLSSNFSKFALYSQCS